MSLSVKFNGFELNQYIDVLIGFTPFSGAEWFPELLRDAGLRRGEDFSYTTYKQKQISMPYTVLEDLKEKHDELVRILNVSEPKELVFGNIPDRVFYAIPTGDLDFDDYECFGEGVITWLIPDGLAHSTVEKVFPAEFNADGILEAAIINQGTEAVPVSYEIVHNHENGFIGIVSEYGVIQYGDVAEVDREIRQKSEVLLKYTKPEDYAAMTDGQGILASGDNFPKNGAFVGWANIRGRAWIGLQNPGSGASWHGACRLVTLPADSGGASGAVNFIARTKVWFEITNANQTGLLEFVVGDENGQHLASIHLVKSAPGSNLCSAIFQVQKNEKNRVRYEPNSNSVTNSAKGQLSIEKTGELFTFVFGGKSYPVRFPEAAQAKARTLTIFLGQYGTRTALVNYMLFGDIIFQKNNVNYLRDIPNRYPEGSVMNVEGETSRMYVDGVPAIGDEVIGSTYFKAPPGETKVQFFYSDFSKPAPTILAKIKEAFL